MNKYAVYVVRVGDVSVDSFSSASLSDVGALANARISRDAYNASEAGVANGAPARIVRVWRRDTAKQL